MTSYAQRNLAPQLEISVSSQLREPGWDAFVSRSARASYMQTALWAEVKAAVGWRSHRILARRQGEIVGGLQLLARTLPMLGGGGYVSHGPVLRDDDPALMDVLLEALQQLVRRERLHYVHVQLPAGYPRCADLVQRRELRPSLLQRAPTATVLVDLTQSRDQLLARMKSKTRYNVRLGLRKGVRIREGNSDDLPTFYALLRATGQRNAFPTQEQRYFENVWDVFDARDAAKLFIAEYEGEAISAFLVLATADTVTYWRGAWNGRHGAMHPNEALHWHVMQWAQDSGYRWYDLDGIQVIQMHGVDMGRADTAFKLGFGGEAVLHPPALEIVPSAGLRWASELALGPGATQHTRALIAALRGARDDDEALQVTK